MSIDSNHPSDLNRDEKIAQMIRVNQAGEYGASRIYEGQLAVLKHKPCAEVIQHMRDQEETHLEAFNNMMVKNHVRPTILAPVWHVAGYLLGAGTALLGEKAAMACTVAVEEVIDEHYESQEKMLKHEKRAPETALRKLIQKCREDEIAHRDISLQHGATETPGYPVITGAIKMGTRLAIWLSKRI
jgi:ubiquinone biosynthesis monooxygenase Coq7